jgi:hypothetical protein
MRFFDHKNKERKHRTNVYLLIVDKEYDDWEENRNFGRVRKWFKLDEAKHELFKYKPVQGAYLNLLKGFDSQTYSEFTSSSTNSSESFVNTSYHSNQNQNNVDELFAAAHNSCNTSICSTSDYSVDNNNISQTNSCSVGSTPSHSLSSANSLSSSFNNNTSPTFFFNRLNNNLSNHLSNFQESNQNIHHHHHNHKKASLTAVLK